MSVGETLALLLALVAVALRVVATRDVGQVGAPSAAAPCPVAIEVVGQGVSCLSRQAARARRIEAGDRIVHGGAEPELHPTKMAPERLHLWSVPIDLNRASEPELRSLDGIGPELARRIIARRPYSRVEDLAQIPGIGTRRALALRSRVVVCW